MKIAFDLDGPLAELLPSFIRHHNKRYKTDYKVGDIFDQSLSTVFGWSRDLRKSKFYDYFASRYFKRLPTVKGAEDGIRKLDENYELIVITARSIGLLKETKKWLNKHFLNKFDALYFTEDEFNEDTKKPIYCRYLGVDVIVEDSLGNAIACAKEGVNVLLFGDKKKYPWNWNNEENLEGIIRVENWHDVVQEINRIDKEHNNI